MVVITVTIEATYYQYPAEILFQIYHPFSNRPLFADEPIEVAAAGDGYIIFVHSIPADVSNSGWLIAVGQVGDMLTGKIIDR